MTVGLLGGSFNPAHAGHRHISLMALKLLGLDQVWWMVSPQNPLKSTQGMAPLELRLRQARKISNHPRIIPCAPEAKFGTTYTVETIDKLKTRFPNIRFVWLMGADNFDQVIRWRNWQKLFKSVPIAIFDRPQYALRALSGKAARRFSRARLAQSAARSLARKQPPAWVFLHIRRNPLSATALRAGGNPFGGTP